MGEYGLMSLQPGWITSRQIEAARIAMSRHIKRGGKIWIRIFPDKPITKKPAETRMGTGKGGVEYYVAVVKPGRILYEMDGMTPDVAKRAFELAQAKLPVLTKHRSPQGAVPLMATAKELHDLDRRRPWRPQGQGDAVPGTDRGCAPEPWARRPELREKPVPQDPEAVGQASDRQGGAR